MRHIAVFLGVVLIGCSGSVGDAEQTPGRGTVGGVCYGNDTCNAGLVCVAKVCVEATPTGDAAIDTSVSDSAVVTTDSGTPVPMDTAVAIPTFEGDIIPMFKSSCGSGDNECHSRAAFHPSPANGCRGWLSLEDAPLGSKDPKTGAPTGCPDSPLYDRLTKLDAWECGDPVLPRLREAQVHRGRQTGEQPPSQQDERRRAVRCAERDAEGRQGEGL